MSEDKKMGGVIYNFKNDWKTKIEAHQKATGEWQVGIKVQSDTLDLLPQTFVTLVTDTLKCMKEAGYTTVKPKYREEKK